jgi:hypothetical protein
MQSHKIDFIFLYNKNIPPCMKVHVHYMNLMKNQIIQKFQNLEILKERVVRQMINFFNHLIKNLCLMGSNYLAFDGFHMCRK